MDLLGSILGSMSGPPGKSEKEKERLKKEKAMQQKMEEKQREASKMFRQKMEKKIQDFIADSSKKSVEFEPMEKYERSIVHDIAEVAGLIAHSFGLDGVDRHIVAWKKEHQVI